MRQSIILLFITAIWTSCQQPEIAPSPEQIAADTDSIYQRIVDVRRQLHQYPELAGAEVQTRETIINYLENQGLEVITDTYGQSVIGVLRGATLVVFLYLS